MASSKPPERRKRDRRFADLYESDEPLDAGPVVPTRSFQEYLRTTPPAPLSPGLKWGLYAIGVLVVLLFAISLYQVGR